MRCDDGRGAEVNEVREVESSERERESVRMLATLNDRLSYECLNRAFTQLPARHTDLFCNVEPVAC